MFLFRNNHLPLVRTREEFDLWIFDMTDALEYFIASLPSSIREQMDYSVASLDALEGWLIETYAGIEPICRRYEVRRVEDASRYIGEIYRRALNAKWTIRLDSPEFVFRELPIVQTPLGRPYETCPFSLATASTESRTGSYIRTVLEDELRHQESSGQRDMSTKTPLESIKGLAAPARSALASAGYTHLEQLAEVTETELERLDGMGKNALNVLQKALSK